MADNFVTVVRLQRSQIDDRQPSEYDEAINLTNVTSSNLDTLHCQPFRVSFSLRKLQLICLLCCDLLCCTGQDRANGCRNAIPNCCEHQQCRKKQPSMRIKYFNYYFLGSNRREVSCITILSFYQFGNCNRFRRKL